MTWNASLAIFGAMVVAWFVLIGWFVVELCANRRDTREREARNERARRETEVEQAIARRRREPEPASPAETPDAAGGYAQP